MNKFAVLIFLAGFFASCEKLSDSKDRYYNFPADSKTDLKRGDTLVFKSNLNNQAKYNVLNITNGYFWESRSRQDGFDNHPFNYYGCQIIYIDSVGKKSTESQSYILNMSYDISVPLLFNRLVTRRSDFISICNYYSTPPSVFSVINWYKKDYVNRVQDVSTYKILNRQFNNVSYCDIDTSLFKSTESHVLIFYCNLKQGLLGFKCSNGEIFELVE